MKYVVSSLLCLVFGLGEAAAQQTVPPLKKEFLDSTFAVLPSETGAMYRRETEWRDSTAGEVRDYYLSNNQLQSREEFEHVRQRRYHGVSEYFANTGQLLTHAEFEHGNRIGELTIPTGSSNAGKNLWLSYMAPANVLPPMASRFPFSSLR